jgi:chemotaxis protein MotB
MKTKAYAMTMVGIALMWGCATEPTPNDTSTRALNEMKTSKPTTPPPPPSLPDPRIAELEKERNDLAAMVAHLRGELSDLEQQLAKQQAPPVEQAQRGLVRALRPEIEKGDIAVDLNSERLLIKLASAYLFGSGEDALKPAGSDALKRIGEILKDYPEYNVEVAGHTDNVPIGSRLIAKFPDNQALSSARAKQAARVLQDAGVDPSRLSVRGYGDTKPLAANADEDGRRKNRRAEIRVTRKE